MSNLADHEQVRTYSAYCSRRLCGLTDRIGKLPECNLAPAFLKELKLPGLPVPQTLYLKATRWLTLSDRDEEREYVPVLISHLITAVYDVVKFLLGRQITRKDIHYMVGVYTLLAMEGRLEKSFKEHTAWLVARAMGDVAPEVPPTDGISAGKIFSPRLNRIIWMRCVLRRRPQDVSLAHSLYQVKRVAPPLVTKLVNKASEEMLRRVTKEEDGEEHIILRRLEGEIERTVDELVKNARAERWTGNIRGQPFPAQSASYEHGVREGGQLHSLLGTGHGLNIPHLIAMIQRGQYVYPVYGWDESVGPNLKNVLEMVDCPEFLPTRRSPVLEPFKVRTITMGPARHYFRARQIQGVLWDLLKGSRSTHLPNRPIQESDISFFVQRAGDRIFPGEEALYVSGDYSAATDNLRPSLSMTCVNRLCDHLSQSGSALDAAHPLRMLFQRVLVGHAIMDGKRGEESEAGRQSWGQLMGSPLSFPVLCIINLAATRWVLEQVSGRIVSLNQSGILVNGDDILFRMPYRGYALWNRVVTAAGLTPSPGKNFVTSRYAVLNSEVYDTSSRTADPVPFLKINLMYGTLARGCERRTSAELLYGDDLEAGGTLGHRCRALIKGFKPEQQDYLITRFIRACQPFLSQAPGVSWFLHPAYGGIGLPSVRRPRIEIHHLRVAAYLSCGGKDQAEAQVFMHWLKQPSKEFNRATLLRAMEVARELHVPTVQVSPEELKEAPERFEIPVKQELLLSALTLGTEFEVTDQGQSARLREWNRYYRLLVRRSLKTYVRGSKDTTGLGLHAMGWEKAMRGPKFRTVFDWSARSGGYSMLRKTTSSYSRCPFSSSSESILPSGGVRVCYSFLNTQ
ncbi:putative RNA dependent RNA polymerase [Epirus cherry virus]|uniref:Putative RNA dependent RNA polymerase n=1 Tax=Epirus cherry virus TaxID=544686 RepID=B3VMK8_9VIRU|nr:putative RNA dependent RNA polymerase [Epirus cherry virus]ACF16357.1 putative RNA dependent RNA polymerase [Epirus cherry virus]